MKISYNITGANRKTLVTALSKELNAPVNYLGAPSFAYEIGGYHIDKTGMVTGPDNRDLVADLQGLHSFIPVTEKYDGVPDIDQHHPGQYADPSVPPTETMLRQAEAWMEGQPAYEDLKLTEREELGFGRERREDWQGAKPVATTTKRSSATQTTPTAWSYFLLKTTRTRYGRLGNFAQARLFCSSYSCSTMTTKWSGTWR